MNELRVIKPGLLTTVQDLGRWGFQSRGVPVAGPMDAYAHRVANALARNPAATATLEITLIGPEIEFNDERLVAVAGATFELTLDGAPMAMHTTCEVTPGSRLKFGRRLNGARAYLAVEGGIAVTPVLGSRATHLISKMGGIEGRALKAGDRLPLGVGHRPSKRADEEDDSQRRGLRDRRANVFELSANSASSAFERRHSFTDSLAGPSNERGSARVRLLPGPQRDFFSEDALTVLQAAPYTVDVQSDRMGLRLRGTTIAYSHNADMISDATPMGTLQVPPSGLPILLMADRQTTGGYPQLATAITADLHIASQLAPGDSVSFTVCSRAEAMAALIAEERALLNIEGRAADGATR